MHGTTRPFKGIALPGLVAAFTLFYSVSDSVRAVRNMSLSGIAVLLCLSSGLAEAETFEVLGQRISFTNPAGYCTPGNSARERDLMAMSQRSVGPGARLVHAAVRCSELEAFRVGRREALDHWLQIQLIGPKGDFKRLEMGREAFLVGLAKTSPRLDAAEINRRIQAALENPDLSLSKMRVTPLGRDGNAVYFSSRMSLNIGESSRAVIGLSGITLLNSLPLTVIVYEATGQAKSREQLQPTLQQLLVSLFTEN